MTLIPSYRSRPSALHAARASVGAGFCCAFALVGALYRNPLILSGAIAGILLAGAAAGVGREVGRSLRLAVPFALLVALVNALVYQQGETLLLRGDTFLGRRWDVTLEATVEGLMNGMRIVVLVAALGGLMSAAVDPDELLKALRRISYRSALTASLATRLVPVLARDAARMGDAARCRPHPPGRLAVVRAALAGALDRAVDVAAALEVRGYSLAGRPARHRRPVSRHDLRVGAAALAIAALAIGGVAAGVGHVEAYPTLDVAAGPAELALASALVLLGGAPLLGRAARLGVARA
jgi:energy-coupling factor transport system permease protein